MDPIRTIISPNGGEPYSYVVAVDFSVSQPPTPRARLVRCLSVD